MASITTQAVVLRAQPYLDHHRLLKLLSPEYGKLTAVAHGALGPKSRLRSASVPFANGEFVLSGRGERLSVTSFSPDSDYYGAMVDLSAIAHASFLCELCDISAVHGEPAASLYTLLLQAFAYLTYDDMQMEPAFVAFLLRMLDVLGYAPELNRCAVCGADRGRPKFSFSKGGLCCAQCAPEAQPITREDLRFLRDARAGKLGVLENTAVRALKHRLVAYCQYCLDMPIKAAQFLDL